MLIKKIETDVFLKIFDTKKSESKGASDKKKIEHYISTWFQKLYARDFPIFMFWISMFEVFTVKVVISFSSVEDDD